MIKKAGKRKQVIIKGLSDERVLLINNWLLNPDKLVKLLVYLSHFFFCFQNVNQIIAHIMCFFSKLETEPVTKIAKKQFKNIFKHEKIMKNVFNNFS